MKKLLLILLLTGLVCSCGKGGDDGGDGGGGGDPVLTKLNIEGTHSIFISSKNGKQKLYGVRPSQVRADGEDVFEIKYFDQDGQEMSYSDPDAVFTSSKFVFLSFKGSELFLISKKDGKVFQVPYTYCPKDNNIKEDKNGNVYYMTYNGLYKVSLSNPSNAEFKQVSAVNDNVYIFYIAPDGSLIYDVHDSGTPRHDMKYRKPDGSYVVVDGVYEDGNGDRYSNIFPFWLGTDNKTYCLYEEQLFSASVLKTNIAELTSEGKVEPVKMIRETTIYNSMITGEFIKLGNRMYVIEYDSFESVYVHDLSSPGEYRQVTVSFNAIPKTVIDNQLYYFSEYYLSLTHINVETGATSVVYDLDETKLSAYKIDKVMEVTTTGIIFSAVLLEDGSYVVAKMELDDSVDILSTILGKVTNIVSLN